MEEEETVEMTANRVEDIEDKEIQLFVQHMLDDDLEQQNEKLLAFAIDLLMMKMNQGGPERPTRKGILSLHLIKL
jgi:hypothetical protein